MKKGIVRIGISGWRYGPWRGVFYPENLPQRAELSFAADIFPTIEINGSFYSLQRPESYRAWYEATPAGFVFAVKGPRFITHMLKLKNCRQAMANFFASGVLRLGEKMGPILWQLPPMTRFAPERLEEFFRLLPRSSAKAAALARRHDGKVRHGAWTRTDRDRPIRHALEIRHDSFRNPDFIALLRRHAIGLVVADTVDWPLLMDATADFVYVRLHGSTQLYASGYDGRAIALWARRIEAWREGREAEGVHAGTPARRMRRDVYVYFDNDAKVRAPFDAQALIHKVAKGKK